MTPRSRVCAWIVLLSCTVLRDTQVFCEDCPNTVTLTTTTTSISLESQTNCTFSTEGKSSTNGSIDGLTSGKIHQVQVHCLSCCKLVTTKPNMVDNLSVNGKTTSSVFVSWTKPGGSNSFYRVKWTNGLNHWNHSVNETNINISNLTAGERYTFIVQSVAGDDRTESEMREISTYTMPEAVQNLGITEITTSSVYVSWTKPGGSNSFYRVKWTNGLNHWNHSVNETNMNVSNLTAGERYTFIVQSVAGDDRTESEMREISTYTKPQAVQNLGITEITTSSVYVSWTKPGGSNSFYRVKWTNGLNHWNHSVNETNMNVSNLTAGERYTFIVQSVAGDDRTESEMREISSYTMPEAVQNLGITEITTSSVYVSWTKPGGSNSFYRVKWTNGLNHWNHSVNETNMNVSNLTAGERYTFFVQSVAGDDRTESEKREISSYTKPEAVQNLGITEITTSSVYVSWTKPGGSNSFYRVKWTNGLNHWNHSVNETNMNVSNLTAGERYTFIVQSVAGDDRTESEMREISSYTMPEAVQNLGITEITTSSVYVSWTKPGGSNSFYRVKWTNGLNHWNHSVNETNMNVSNLTAGERYTFIVQSVAGDDRTESEMREISTYTKPEAVQNLGITEITTSSVYVSWTKPGGSNSFYRVKWTNGLNHWNHSVNETNMNVSNLTAGERYTFIVQSVAGDDRTESEMREISTYTKPEAVQSLGITEITTSSVYVSWTKPGGSNSFYRVKWTNGLNHWNHSVNETNMNVSNLTAGERYTFIVQSVAGDDRTESEMREISTYTKPEAVQNLGITEITTSSVYVSWTKPGGSNSFYRVKWTNGLNHWNHSVNETNMNVSNLTAGERYTFIVQSVAGDDRTESEMREISTYTKPEAVQSLGITEITTSSVYVSWTKPGGSNSFYRVKWTNGLNHWNHSVNETNMNVSNLTAGERYTFIVQSVAGDDRTESEMREISTYTKPEAVQSLGITEITTSSVYVSWTKPGGSNSFYRVKWTNGLNHWNHSVNETNMNVSNLTAGERYTFIVQSVAGDDRTESEMREISTYTKPDKPANVMATPRGTDSLGIAWTLSGEKTHFIVNLTNNDLMYKNHKQTSNSSVVFTDLLPGRIYTVSVTTVAGPLTAVSDTFSFATVPTPPGSINVINRTISSIMLVWAGPHSMDGTPNVTYEITYQHEGGKIQRKHTVDNKTELSSLSPGIAYLIEIKTFGPQHLSSTPVNISLFTLPNPVVDLKAVAESPASLTVLWSDPVGVQPYYKYLVEVFNNSRDSVKAETVSNNSAHVSELEIASKYFITVTTVAAPGSSSTTEETSSYTMPTAVKNLTVARVTNTSIWLQWLRQDDNQASFKYLVQAFQENLMVHNGSTENLDYTLFSLTPGALYTFKVFTVIETVKSEAASVETYTVPEAVQNLNITEITTSSVYVSWTKPGGSNSFYRVKWTNGLNHWNHSVNETNMNVSNLTAGERYTFIVQSVTGDDRTESEKREILTYTKPEAVLNLNITEITTSSVYVSWTKPGGSNSFYRVKWTNGLNHWNHSVNETNMNVSNLTAGERYTFIVQSVAGDDRTESEMREISGYTMPEAVSHMNVTGSTVELTVSWKPPFGHVFSYCAQLYVKGKHLNTSTDLSNKITSFQFKSLKPGVDYCVVLVSKSGPHETSSSPVCNATFPNPPGPITVQSQTLMSINFTWTFPVDMTPGNQTSFNVTTVKGTNSTRDNWFFMDGLLSGNPYSISVVTVGVRDYWSTEETAQNYTRPYPATDLSATQITSDSVSLAWKQQEVKWRYSYLVQVPNKTTNNTRTVSTQDITITELQSGTNFSFIVTIVTADGTKSDPVSVSYFTRPLPVNDLVVESLNETSVHLQWRKPLEYKECYLYWVEVTGFTNKTTMVETMEISQLYPGTPWTFCVYVDAAGMKGEAVCTLQFTWPETVDPTFSTQSNDSIQISWTKPLGLVDKYHVNLSRSSNDSHGSMQLSYIELKGNSTGYLFKNLSPGRLYSTVVTAQSGPFSATSESRENATFPNPPGPITILTKTAWSLHFTWSEAPLMEGTTFSYQLTLTQALDGNTTYTRTNTTTNIFDSLPSGTSFIISVWTLGIWNFESQKVNEMVSTRPLSIRSLTANAGVTEVNLHWMKPDEYKDSYRYNLTWEGPGASSVLVHDNKHKLDDLVPGSHYDINVTTETSDGTQAEPWWISICTQASPVQSLTCETPNEDNAQIILSWLKPKGQNSGFRVSVNNMVVHQNNACCAHNISNLRHYTEYDIIVETLSCGEASIPKTLQCTTGITNPALPSDYQSKVVTVDQEHNKFSIKIDPTLFDPVKGPITHVGVLVTKKLSGECTNCRKYLEKTYYEFKDGTSEVYLATVTRVDRPRNSEEVTIEVGNNGLWENYSNGALDAKTTYRYAIVLFSSLVVQEDLVDGVNSLVSFTGFKFIADLPVDSALIGIAVGLTLGIFCILFIVLIGFIIFWRRISKQESPDIQIQNLRAKASAPVRVEEYEAYFKKQKADSNCGFAEEFEDLKPVGTTQAKIQALSLENKPKNRYTNVLPYDSSRVKLSIIRGSPSDDYINANYMPGYNSRKEFIAAQGPLPATVNDFWRMIWEKNVQTLVMLTRCNEQGRVKCEQYWSPGTKHFENITVTTASEIPLDDWTIRDFTIKNVKTAETRSVRHFHFTAWPDHGVPETTELLISFRHLVREHMNQFSRHCPTVVHCSAGVGRTGTFIAIDHLIFQVERENVVDVYGIVNELRMHRVLMVQTEDQYVFLNQCALDIIRSRTGTNVDLIYQNAAAFSIYENLEPSRRFSKNRYQNT